MTRNAPGGRRDGAPTPGSTGAGDDGAGRGEAVTHLARKVARHVRWARSEGIGRLVEEDRLDPRARAATAWRKARWRRRQGVPAGSAVPVYVVGLQRSGTNMLLRGVDEAPEVEVRGENDRRVFHRYRLRGDDVLVDAVRASRHPLVLVKPLCDSQRVDELLALPGLPGGRALWVYRDADARARSEVAKFGSSNLRALQSIAADGGAGTWQGQRLPGRAVELVRSFDTATMSPDTAAVLFWVVRNGLFFDLGLDRRDDVHLVCYDAFVADPEHEMRRLCDAVGLAYRPALCAHVEPRRSHGTRPLDVDPRVRALTEETGARLAAALAAGAPPDGAARPADRTS